MSTTPPRAVLAVAVAAACLLGFAEWHAMQVTSRAPQLLTGELWQQMSTEAKVAFVWSVGNLVDLGSAQAGGKSINEVVRYVDAFYATHEGDLDRPVIEAIFQEGRDRKSLSGRKPE